MLAQEEQINKAVSVIESIETWDQLKVAHKYYDLFEKKYPHQKFIQGFLFGILSQKRAQLKR